jgi:hypothetical protein
MRSSKRGVFLVLMLTGSQLLAQADDPGKTTDRLTELIAASHRPMASADEGFTGPGAALLLDAAEQSIFFLVGESHGNIETPALTSRLLQSIRPFGYSALAVEIGPLAADQMKALAQQPDAMSSVQAFHDRWPFTVAFFFWQEEVAMWLGANGQGYDLWGLDQEFIGSARFLLSRLDALVASDELRPQIGKWRKLATEGFQIFETSGDSSRAFLSVVDPDELAAFADRLPAEASAARQLTDELRQSAIVYQHYRDERYFLNNHDRVRLMKRHLAEYIEQAGGLKATPRVVFKFGSVHMGRGYSPMHQLDLGNAAAELAAARFSESFHLNVSAVRSVKGDGTEKDWTESSPELRVFGEHLADGPWGVFDLRTLRSFFAVEKNREAHPEIAELVFRYDSLALAPVFHAATPMIDLPF